MNREHWKELLPIITAFANGDRVEVGSETNKSTPSERISFNADPKYYRIAPRTIRIGKFDVPEPYRECLNTDQPYYIADPTLESFFTTCEWSDDEGDIEYYRRGLIHLTPEAAALHGKALASLTAGEGVEL